jgi:hypothetical protein
MVEWSDVERAYPAGRFLAEGGFKKVYLVSTSPGGLSAGKAIKAPAGKLGAKEPGTTEPDTPFAMSVIDVHSARSLGLEAPLATELWVSHLLARIAALGRCPHFLALHQCFRSPCEPPSEWRRDVPEEGSGGEGVAGLKWRLASLRTPPHRPPPPTWRSGPPLNAPERSRGRLGASRGASKPALRRPQNGDFALLTRCVPVRRGCTAPSATNFDPAANVYDGSCAFETLGCTNAAALNYGSTATRDDGSCISRVPGCAASWFGRAPTKHGRFPTKHGRLPTKNGRSPTKHGRSPTKHGRSPTKHGRSSTKHGRSQTKHGRSPTKHGRLPTARCTWPLASNYLAGATVDDGSCIAPPTPGCTDASAANWRPSATADDGSCHYVGCTAAGCWFEVAPDRYEGAAPRPTPAYLEAWHAPAQPGAAGALAGWTLREPS